MLPLPVPPPQAGAGPVSTRRALAISLTQPLPLLAAGRALHFQPRRAVSGFDGTVVVFALAGGLLFLGSFLVPFTDQGSWAFAEKPFGTALWLLMMGGLAAACLTGGARVAARCVRDLRWNALRHDVIVGLKGVTLRTVDGRERISFAAAAQREVLRRTPRGLDRVIAARAIGVEAGLRRQHVFVAEWLALGGAGGLAEADAQRYEGRPREEGQRSEPLYVAVVQDGAALSCLGVFEGDRYADARHGLRPHVVYEVPTAWSTSAGWHVPAFDPREVTEPAWPHEDDAIEDRGEPDPDDDES